jgi:hypothetical protein
MTIAYTICGDSYQSLIGSMGKFLRLQEHRLARSAANKKGARLAPFGDPQQNPPVATSLTHNPMPAARCVQRTLFMCATGPFGPSTLKRIY